MDATRIRRTRDQVRQRWYAAWRCSRFARRLGFDRPSSRLLSAFDSVSHHLPPILLHAR
jgi:hypothetical protein